METTTTQRCRQFKVLEKYRYIYDDRDRQLIMIHNPDEYCIQAGNNYGNGVHTNHLGAAKIRKAAVKGRIKPGTDYEVTKQFDKILRWKLEDI
jgi:hypothetical protein